MVRDSASYRFVKDLPESASQAKAGVRAGGKPGTMEVAMLEASTLVPDPEQTDRDPEALGQAFERYCAEGLHLAGRERSSLENFRFLAGLAERSGAFAFLALQQYVAAAYLDPGESVRIGVAFGQLRRPDAVQVRTDQLGRLSGRVPWFSGSHLFDEVVLGFHSDGCEVLTRVNARDRPGFRHGPPMPLVAMESTQTVEIEIDGVHATRRLREQPVGTMRESDRLGIAWQTPLMVGNARASLRLLLNADLAAEDKARLEVRTFELAQALEHAIEAGAPAADSLRLRSRIGALMVRQARLAALAGGGRALLQGYRAGRIYREALVLNLMAQTPEIVQDAIEEDLACA